MGNVLSNPESFVRPEVRQLVPYETKYIPQCIKLDANENPFPGRQECAKRCLLRNSV